MSARAADGGERRLGLYYGDDQGAAAVDWASLASDLGWPT